MEPDVDLEILSSTPMAARKMTMEEPPALMNGSAWPVVGNSGLLGGILLKAELGEVRNDLFTVVPDQLLGVFHVLLIRKLQNGVVVKELNRLFL